MMWQILFLLVATAVATHEDLPVECTSEVFHRCEDPEGSPEEFPGTEEELDKLCKYTFKFFQCINSLIVNCSEDNQQINYVRQLRSTIMRVCDKDSLLYSALADRLPCLKRNVVNTIPCPRMSEDSSQSFTDNLAGIGITDVEAPDSESACLHSLYAMGCFASKAGKACGDIARGVVVDLIQGFDEPFSRCRPGVKEKFPAIAEMLQLEAEKEEAVENEIENEK